MSLGLQRVRRDIGITFEYTAESTSSVASLRDKMPYSFIFRGYCICKTSFREISLVFSSTAWSKHRICCGYRSGNPPTCYYRTSKVINVQRNASTRSHASTAISILGTDVDKVEAAIYSGRHLCDLPGKVTVYVFLLINPSKEKRTQVPKRCNDRMTNQVVRPRPIDFHHQSPKDFIISDVILNISLMQ